MKKNFRMGFIGCGKMAGAIIRGLLKADFISPSLIVASQENEENIEERSKELGIEIITDNKELVIKSDVIIIAVKPNQVKAVLDEISSKLDESKLIVSVAAGVTTKFIENNIPQSCRVIRVMPNTPVLVSEGMSGIFGGKFATSTDINIVKTIFETIGKTLILDNEDKIDIVTAISGSGPAFFYKVINDIALAGEKMGLDYEQALKLSIQTAIGSAKMALNRTLPMETLISNVATKGGCTRVGVDVLEESKINEIFYNVIKETTQKAKQLGV